MTMTTKCQHYVSLRVTQDLSPGSGPLYTIQTDRTMKKTQTAQFKVSQSDLFRQQHTVFSAVFLQVLLLSCDHFKLLLVLLSIKLN